ncbi:von Willebrand factor-like [Saccoglossus kowalevskii]|uniref:BMP-binding endothelial regulator protein-like n=1 Tax=Saccoglossus kowalevskii TaxID=10224 RepID=A0ABM0M9C2_SACKO|nr:PREDICTED: BMP-binding endothelial regulator protein-like [Saccoglossus kowalevskii]
MMLRLLLILAVTSLIQAAPNERFVEETSPSNVYRVVEGPLTWNDAKAKCEAMDCKLAQPKSVQANDALKALLVKGYYWLGITDLNHEGRFTYYTDDQDIVYDNWNAGVPNNGNGTEHCANVILHSTFNYSTWFTSNCSEVNEGGICECRTSGASGDPHMRTFDGRAYTFQGICWYTLFKDCTDKSRFDVTIMFEPREDSTPDQVRTRTIAFNVTVGNQYAIVNGLDVTTGSTGGKMTDAKVITIQQEDKNIKLHFTSKNTTFSFNWTLRLHALDVSYNGSFYKGKLCGLMGNADGDTRNDFQNPDRSIAKDVLEFGESWKVNDKKCF